MQTTHKITRADAERLDAADPLAGFRDRFTIADEGTIYLDGNSLGRLPRDTPAYLEAVLNEGWGQGLIGSWHEWIEWSSALGDRLARAVLGARPGEVVVCDSTSVNLYKLAAAALDGAEPSRRTIVVDAEEFPTDRYIVQGLARARGLNVRTMRTDLDAGITLDDLTAALDRDVALVVLSMVSYRCGALLDMAAVNEAARAVGARVLWDLSHAVGAVPIDLTASGAELAVGCTYKYLNAGPGAPAFLYVRGDLHAELRQPIWGWFGQQDQFDMGPEYEPVEHIDRFLVSTPPVLSMAPLGPALTLFEEAGIGRLRTKSVRLTEFTVDLTRQWLEPYGFRLASPATPDRRGGHVTLEHPDAWRICRALATRARVVSDFRMPRHVRLAPVPLYTRFVDVWDAMDRLRHVMSAKEYEDLPTDRLRVT
jgi:kynureninase